MVKIAKIDGCLSARDDHLYIEECDTVKLVERFGSPVFVLSESQLRQNIRSFKKAFSDRWTEGQVDILPAIKANWTLATRRILTQEGAGADIYSEGELHSALFSGLNPELVSVNGGGKSEEFIRKCVEAGVRITVEDLDEPEIIDKVAGTLNKTAKIRFRVKPDFPNLWRLTDFAQEYASIDMGIQVYKSGVPNQYLVDLGKKVLDMKNVELTGFHLHIGRHNPSLWFWKGIIEKYAKLIADLCHAWGEYRPKEIDIGGGFAISRDPFNKQELRKDVALTLLGWPLTLAIQLISKKLNYKTFSLFIEKIMAKGPSSRRAPTIEEYAEVIVNTMRNVLRKNNIDTRGIKLQLEPGRRLYGDAGIHLTKVKKVKHQSKPIKLNWILTDTTYFFLCGGIYEYNLHDFIVANKTDARPVMVADVVGHSCYADRILPFVRVPDLQTGDIIALLDTGAYQEVSASNFNALPRPATILVNGDQADIIKRAETIEDVYRRDIIPEYLV